MIVLGLDPGYAIVGYGVIDTEKGRHRLLGYGAITTPAGMEMSRRLLEISRDMRTLLDTYKPDMVAVEELFWGHNVTTGIGVSHGRGVILLSVAQREIPIFEYTPMQIKQAVAGYGLATKQQVMDMTKRLLKMDKPARPDDAADAIAVALCHGRTSTSRLLGIK